jgi:hypothetical protein
MPQAKSYVLSLPGRVLVSYSFCTQKEANAFSLWNNNLGYQGILESWLVQTQSLAVTSAKPGQHILANIWNYLENFISVQSINQIKWINWKRLQCLGPLTHELVQSMQYSSMPSPTYNHATVFCMNSCVNVQCSSWRLLISAMLTTTCCCIVFPYSSDTSLLVPTKLQPPESSDYNVHFRRVSTSATSSSVVQAADWRGKVEPDTTRYK